MKKNENMESDQNVDASLEKANNTIINNQTDTPKSLKDINIPPVLKRYEIFTLNNDRDE